jgi:hypothetical protein
MKSALNIVDGEVFLSHGDRQFSHAIAHRSLLWAVGDINEEVYSLTQPNRLSDDYCSPK